MAENVTIWEIYSIMSSQVITSFSGVVSVDISSMQFLLEAFDVPRSHWIFMVEKMSHLVKLMITCNQAKRAQSPAK